MGDGITSDQVISCDVDGITSGQQAIQQGVLVGGAAIDDSFECGRVWGDQGVEDTDDDFFGSVRGTTDGGEEVAKPLIYQGIKAPEHGVLGSSNPRRQIFNWNVKQTIDLVVFHRPSHTKT